MNESIRESFPLRFEQNFKDRRDVFRGKEALVILDYKVEQGLIQASMLFSTAAPLPQTPRVSGIE